MEHSSPTKKHHLPLHRAILSRSFHPICFSPLTIRTSMHLCCSWPSTCQLTLHGPILLNLDDFSVFLFSFKTALDSHASHAIRYKCTHICWAQPIYSLSQNNQFLNFLYHLEIREQKKA